MEGEEPVLIKKISKSVKLMSTEQIIRDESSDQIQTSLNKSEIVTTEGN